MTSLADLPPFGAKERLEMNPHPIEHRLEMLGVHHTINLNGRPLSEAIVGHATNEGLKIRAHEVYRLLRDQLAAVFDGAVSEFPNAMNYRYERERLVIEDLSKQMSNFPTDNQLEALEMTLRYMADDIWVCRQAINDHRVQIVDQALKTEPKK